MIVQIIVYSTIIWALSALYYQIFLRHEKYFRYNRIFLLLGLAFGILVPLMGGVSFFPYNITDDGTLFGVRSPEILFTSSIDKVSENSQISTKMILVLYILVMIFLLLRFLRSLLSIFKLYVNNKKEYKQKYIVIETSQIPFSFLNLVFLNGKQQEENDKILGHELVHVKHYHSLDIIFIEILKIIFWFNPMIFLFSKYIKENHEFTADNEVILNVPKKIYSEILIRQLQSGMQYQVTNNFINSLIKNRIKMMYKSKNQNRWKYLMAIGFGICLVFFTNNLQSQTDIKPAKRVSKDISGEKIFETVEEMPRFPGCEDKLTKEEKEKCSVEKLMKFVAENLKYPEAAKKNGVEGKVIAKFTISNKGAVENIEILKDIDYGCGDEVKRILLGMNKLPERWTPGKNKGKSVNVYFTLPVMFRLSDKDKTGNLK